MKTTVAVVLIVCGTFLVVTPYIYNTVATMQAANWPSITSQHVAVTLPSYAPGICMLAGIVTIGLAAILSLRRSHEPSEK